LALIGQMHSIACAGEDFRSSYKDDLGLSPQMLLVAMFVSSLTLPFLATFFGITCAVNLCSICIVPSTALRSSISISARATFLSNVLIDPTSFL
jgi:hypothetical protein